MIDHSYKKSIFIRSLVIVITIGILIFVAIQKYIEITCILTIVLIIELWLFYKIFSKIQLEFEQFVEGIRYHDFSQFFNTGKNVKFVEFRKGYNAINKEFLDISKEKETQYQYLQKMLELLDNGILLYDMENGEVKWMNESLKTLLAIPYFKNIQSLKWKYISLLELIHHLKPGKSILYSLKKDSKTINMQLTSSQFKTEGRLMQLIVFYNISEVVDITESQAWNQLLRILTHEIMNSIAPISSLASTIEIGMKDSKKDYDADVILGIETIKNRSEGLIRFAEAYRNLNKIEQPKISKFIIRELFESMDILFEPKLSQSNIELEIILPEMHLEINADKNLLEQVFINLMLNAIDAVKGTINPCIQLYAAKENGKIMIKVVDNGKGMSTAIQERIFIPFFSTKGSGSGIGLSLCKQIILLHGGSIYVHSIEGKGSQFIISI
ncbi:sensor histidine kinase [Rhizosphaericola mali]|uniref:histidine kinase n=1 Tax=Rhizosphaericola mali TaxID=2545455 RepID=A0A5P2G300_9BACT|nr:HAMP domain-containing sensor histidine kinase [Rhizosphaericola mali]QES89098.1 HAMP domain-containing histidine kinase [Rhizosphaericola mali]